MLHKTEFPDFTLDVVLPAGFVDVSWHNDAMPRFVKSSGDRVINLWINYPFSDVPTFPKFMVDIRSDDEQVDCFSSNSWTDVLNFIEVAQ